MKKVCARYLHKTKTSVCLLNSGFFNTLKELIEIVLFNANKDAANGNAKGGSSSSNNNNSSSSSGDGDLDDDVDLFEIGRSGGRSSAFFAVNIIEDVSAFQPRFTENFSVPLIKLSQRLARDHVQAATLATRTMTATMSQIDGNGLQKVLATPSLAIFEEALSENSKEVVSCGSGIRTLCTCLRLLGSSECINDFGEVSA